MCSLILLCNGQSRKPPADMEFITSCLDPSITWLWLLMHERCVLCAALGGPISAHHRGTARLRKGRKDFEFPYFVITKCDQDILAWDLEAVLPFRAYSGEEVSVTVEYLQRRWWSTATQANPAYMWRTGSLFYFRLLQIDLCYTVFSCIRGAPSTNPT